MIEDIEGYVHISKSIEKTNDKIDKIRRGELKPLITSSKKEQERIGGYYPSDQVIFAGRTGCVLSGTKIKIRKINNISKSSIIISEEV